MRIMWKIMFIIYFGQLHYLKAVPRLTLCSSQIKRQNCVLECYDTTITLAVKFEHPSGVSQGLCIVPGDNGLCNSLDYEIYQALPITYLNITSLDKSRDEGEWRCVHGSNSPTQTLYVSSPFGTQTQPQVTITGSELKVTCEMPCQYPTSAVSVEVIYAEKNSTTYRPFSPAPTVQTDLNDNTGCDSYESNYKAVFTLTKSNNLHSLLNKYLKFKCNYTHSLIQESTGDTGPASSLIEIKFPDLETTTQSITDTTTTTSSITTEGTTTTTNTSTNKSTQHHGSSSSSIPPSTTTSPRNTNTKNMATNSVSVTTKVNITNDSNKGKKSYTTYIIIGSVGGSALIVLICVVTIVLKKRVSSKSNSLQKTEQYPM